MDRNGLNPSRFEPPRASQVPPKGLDGGLEPCVAPEGSLAIPPPPVAPGQSLKLPKVTDNQRAALMEVHRISQYQGRVSVDGLWDSTARCLSGLELRRLVQRELGTGTVEVTPLGKAFVLQQAAELLTKVHMSAGAGFYVDNCRSVDRAFGARVRQGRVEITPDHGSNWVPVDLKEVHFRYAASNARIEIPGF